MINCRCAACKNGAFRRVSLSDIHRLGAQRRHRQRNLLRPAGVQDRRGIRHLRRRPKDRAHTCPDGLRAIRVCAATAENHGNLQRVRRPQDRAQIARVLQTVQNQAARREGKREWLRQSPDKEDPLGRLHLRDPLHHIRRDPELLQPRRQRRQRHIVRRDHKLQPRRQPLQRLGKELCPVGDELAAGRPI